MRRRGHKLFWGFVLAAMLLLILKLLLQIAEIFVGGGGLEEWWVRGGPLVPDLSVEFWLFVAAAISAGLIWYLAVGFRTLHKRRRVPTAQEAMSRDPRPPILLLRPFTRDAIAQKKLDGVLFFEGILIKTLEEKFGPVVAIGDPSDDLAPLGAKRWYVRDGNWRRDVTRLLKKAQLVVVQADLSEGVLWELSAALKHVNPQRLLIEFSGIAVDSAYKEFRKRTSDIFPCPLPRAIGEANFIYFGPRWGARRSQLPPYEKKRRFEKAFLTFVSNRIA